MISRRSVSEQRTVHEVAWDFENELNLRRSPSIEDWIVRHEDLPASVLFEELLKVQVEATQPERMRGCDSTQTSGQTEVQPSTRIQFQQRFPQFATIVDCVFDELEEEMKVAARDAISPSKTFDRSEDVEKIKGQSVLARYEMMDEIARGGSCVVWQAYDHHLHRMVAIKYLLSSKDTPDMRARLEQEARISARLQHANIVPIYELAYFDYGRPFVCMKLVEGKTLKALIIDVNPPSQKELISIFAKLCEAVAFAHSRSIIHRDLKPNNIMVDAFGEVQVMDWGLAKDLSSDESRSVPSSSKALPSSPLSLETMMGTVMGTLAYMPPEQASGDISEIDKRSDVFALGAILCKIITGEPPRDESTVEQMHRSALDGCVKQGVARLRKSKVRSSLRRLALTSMSSNKEKRPADATVMLHRLNAIARPNRVIQFFRRSFFALLFLCLLIFGFEVFISFYSPMTVVIQN